MPCHTLIIGNPRDKIRSLPRHRPRGRDVRHHYTGRRISGSSGYRICRGRAACPPARQPFVGRPSNNGNDVKSRTFGLPPSARPPWCSPINQVFCSRGSSHEFLVAAGGSVTDPRGQDCAVKAIPFVELHCADAATRARAGIAGGGTIGPPSVRTSALAGTRACGHQVLYP